MYPFSFQSVTKERQIKLIQQQNDINGLSRQVIHVMNFTNWAIASGSSTALLYSKRLVRNIQTLNPAWILNTVRCRKKGNSLFPSSYLFFKKCMFYYEICSCISVKFNIFLLVGVAFMFTLPKIISPYTWSSSFWSAVVVCPPLLTEVVGLDLELIFMFVQELM